MGLSPHAAPGAWLCSSQERLRPAMGKAPEPSLVSISQCCNQVPGLLRLGKGREDRRGCGLPSPQPWLLMYLPTGAPDQAAMAKLIEGQGTRVSRTCQHQGPVCSCCSKQVHDSSLHTWLGRKQVSCPEVPKARGQILEQEEVDPERRGVQATPLPDVPARPPAGVTWRAELLLSSFCFCRNDMKATQKSPNGRKCSHTPSPTLVFLCHTPARGSFSSCSTCTFRSQELIASSFSSSCSLSSGPCPGLPSPLVSPALLRSD